MDIHWHITSFSYLQHKEYLHLLSNLLELHTYEFCYQHNILLDIEMEMLNIFYLQFIPINLDRNFKHINYQHLWRIDLKDIQFSKLQKFNQLHCLYTLLHMYWQNIFMCIVLLNYLHIEELDISNYKFLHQRKYLMHSILIHKHRHIIY